MITSGCPTVLRMFWNAECLFKGEGWRTCYDGRLKFWKVLKVETFFICKTNCNFFVTLHEKIMNQKPRSSNMNSCQVVYQKTRKMEPENHSFEKTNSSSIHLHFWGFTAVSFRESIYKTIWFAKRVYILLQPKVHSTLICAASAMYI